ncbi:hypothetical protein KUCAC02_026403 [Chaenocephalus aceratus]|uniref:Uncharacterized protein n=1 Tax=Chaenocephalus aceratus TaxID=36190 RepID=A0ACB9VY60_CHAAC|nr:hypothetical protein KUCAC02_026403 [Chaenocephalus aceratus]
MEIIKVTEGEDNFVPVFETQVPDWEQSQDSQYLEQSERRPDSSTDLFEQDREETGEEQFEGSHCGASKGRRKQKDFVKRNIELVSDSEGDMWAVSVPTGQGYIPEPSDLEQLIDIDSKMRLLLPVEEFASMNSSYRNLTMSQWKIVFLESLKLYNAVLRTQVPFSLSLLDVDKEKRQYINPGAGTVNYLCHVWNMAGLITLSESLA